MKIKRYEEAMGYVEANRGEMLSFIVFLSEAADTVEALFERLAQAAARFGNTPDEELWHLWDYRRARYERERQIEETRKMFSLEAAE